MNNPTFVSYAPANDESILNPVSKYFETNPNVTLYALGDSDVGMTFIADDHNDLGMQPMMMSLPHIVLPKHQEYLEQFRHDPEAGMRARAFIYIDAALECFRDPNFKNAEESNRRYALGCMRKAAYLIYSLERVSEDTGTNGVMIAVNTVRRDFRIYTREDMVTFIKECKENQTDASA